MSPLRLLMTPNQPAQIALTASWKSVNLEAFLKEYVDLDKATEILTLLEQEKKLIAKRIALFSTLKNEVATKIEDLSMAEVNTYLLQKYPELYL